MTTIGQLLTDAREQKKMTLNEVSEITKIRSSYLHALEEGRYSVFSSEIHLQGFLANYAKFLGLDIERIRALYRRERRIKPEPLKRDVFTSKDRPKFVLTPKMIVFPFIAVAVIGVIVYFVRQYEVIAQPPSLTVTEPQENAVTASANLLVSGQVELGNTLTVNNEEVTTVDRLGFFEVYVRLPIEGVNKITVVAESGLGKQTVVERTVTYQPTPLEQLTIKVVSNSTKSIDYSIAKDGAVAEGKTIATGGEFTTGAISSVVITLKDPNSVKVYANNQLVTLAVPSSGASATRITYQNGTISAESAL